jgi:phosphate acetyltransferase
MTVDLMARLRAEAQACPQRVVFPEAREETILRAARRLADEGLCLPVLLGARSELQSTARALGLDLDGLEILDAADEAVWAGLADDHLRLFPESTAKGIERRLRSPLNVGALLVAAGRADALVAGIANTTEDVILAAMTFIGMQPGLSSPSSMMVLRIPGYDGPQGPYLVFADCAVAVAPDVDELAEIALVTAQTTRVLMGWEPRVAMLSFSTRGSGDHESVDRVREAVRLARERNPKLLIDGELQLDAAVVPAVAARKVLDGSDVAGRANVLVFPDLNAANIAYKCAQRFAGADVYGPFLQGFAKTASDLSRGATVADVVGAAVVASVHAQGLERLQRGDG